MKISNVKSWSSEKISRRIFYLLIGLSVLVFGLFFLVGYDMPFEENPDFNAPLFTSALIVLMCVLLLVALALAVCSFLVSRRKAASVEKTDVKQIPELKIARCVWGGLALLLVITFGIGSSEPIRVNGSDFTDWTWLKLSDMLVYTSSVLLLGAFVAVAFGATRYIRKEKK